MVKMVLAEQPTAKMQLCSETIPTETYYELFWDSFQQMGKRTDCSFMFAGRGWTAESLRPKHKLKPAIANSMFYACCDVGVIDYGNLADKIDLSGATQATNLFYGSAIDNISVDISEATAADYAFGGASTGSSLTNLTLKMSPTLTKVSNMFYNCKQLKHLNFMEGSLIACTGLKFSDCTKLTHESLMSIISALLRGVTGKTLTLGTTNLAKLTNAEKAIATQKGWTLA